MFKQEAFETRMIDTSVSRCEIFSEFSEEESFKYFSRNDKCVRSHIDTLYYFVKIAGDGVGTESKEILTMLAELEYLKEQKKASYSAMVDFHGLSVEAAGYSIYEYRLSFPEMYDIFISSYIPNDNTPRIVVQLRTRALVLQGPCEAVRESIDKVREILNEYDLRTALIDVNRVDYAYHTNLIQNPYKYFCDEKLQKNLCSTMRKYMKVGTIGEDITLETLSLGQRKSNNIFFRAYDKTCEVIEKAYKSFFIEKWKEDGLISEYDYYVLMYAYEVNSYVAGVHLGRMYWYIRYGKDEKRKQEFRDLIQKYRVNADNNKQLEKKLSGILPPITLIMNIEFQTKRKFYTEIKESLEKAELDCEPELKQLFSVIALRKQIQSYLTTSTVCWVEDRKAKELKPLDWWERIQSCKIESDKEYAALVRKRDLGSDIKKTERRLKNTIAHLQIIRNRSTDSKTFHEDASDVLCYLNDNDFYGFGKNPNGTETILKQKDYGDIRARKARQDKGLIKSIEVKIAIEQEKLENAKNFEENEE